MLFITDKVDLDIIPPMAVLEMQGISIGEVLAIITARYKEANAFEETPSYNDKVTIWTSLITDARNAALISSSIGLEIGCNASFQNARDINDLDIVVVCNVKRDWGKNTVAFYSLKIV